MVLYKMLQNFISTLARKLSKCNRGQYRDKILYILLAFVLYHAALMAAKY